MVIAASLAAAGCASDRELPPADLVCGDGIVSLPFESCDIDSPGCIDCQIAQGWSCDDDQNCRTVCGDGFWARPPENLSPIHPDFLLYEQCDDSAPDSEGACNSSCRVNFKSEACDLNGFWLVRQTDFSLALGVLVQTSSTWYVHHITQTGSGDAGDPGQFAIDQSIACGVQVSGSAAVRLPIAGERAMMYRNSQDGQLYIDGGTPLEGEIERAPRAGTIERDGEGCQFEITRHYGVRGLDATFLPADFTDRTPLSALPPLPARPPGEDITTPPTGVFNLDVDADGLPGLSWPVVVGALNGVRATVQRDFTDYGPALVRANASEFNVPGAFDVEENVIQVVTSGSPDLLTTLSSPDPDRPSIVTFRFLGRQLTDPGVTAVLEGPLKADPDADLQTCANVKRELVHRDSSEIGGI